MKDLWRKIKEKSDSSEARWVLIFGYIFAISAKMFNYLRYLLISYFFGASEEMDVFWMTHGIGEFIPSLAREGLLVGTIPVLKESESKYGEKVAYSLMAEINKYLIIGGIILVLSYALYLPKITGIIAIGFTKHQRILIQSFTIWLLPYYFFFTLRIGSEIWSIHKRNYYLLEKSLLFSNVISICVLLFIIHTNFHPRWVAISLSVGVFSSFTFMINKLKPYPIFYHRVSLMIIKKNLKRIFFLSLAILGSSGANFIYKTTDKLFASLLPTGAITCISFSRIALGGILGPLGAIYSKMILGKLSEDISRGNMDRIRERFYIAISLISVYFIPFLTLLWLMSLPILKILFEHGLYTETAVQKTVNAFKGYLIGYPFAYISSFLIRYSQARQKPYRIIPITYIGAGLNALLDWMFVQKYQEFGLAIATSCVQIVTVLVLFYLFKKEINIDAKLALRTLSIGFLFSFTIWYSHLILIANWAPHSFIINSFFLLFLTFFLWIINEKLNLVPSLPQEWRIKYILKRIFSNISKGGHQ